MGRDFERDVVVEGLEDAGMIEAAALLGAGFGQGYGLARPMPPEDLAAWQARRQSLAAGGPLRSFLGALAFHWLFVHEARNPLALEACPLSAFLQERGLHRDEVAHWHRRVHEGVDAREASHRLMEWLVARVQEERTAR
jgi:hypothetical protein